MEGPRKDVELVEGEEFVQGGQFVAPGGINFEGLERAGGEVGEDGSEGAVRIAVEREMTELREMRAGGCVTDRGGGDGAESERGEGGSEVREGREGLSFKLTT